MQKERHNKKSLLEDLPKSITSSPWNFKKQKFERRRRYYLQIKYNGKYLSLQYLSKKGDIFPIVKEAKNFTELFTKAIYTMDAWY